MKDTTYLPPDTPSLYEGPDVYNPILDPPEGEINYLDIMENDDNPKASGRQLISLRGGSVSPLTEEDERPVDRSYNNQLELGIDQSHRELEGLPMGRGWSRDGKVGDKDCNGTWDSQCGRGAAEPCLLYGHNDGRGGWIFDSLSGWMVVKFTIKEGIIIIKFDTWYTADSAVLTKGWTAENNGATRGRDLTERRLDLCDAFRFEYAINGKITSLTKTEFEAKKMHPQRVVETMTLLDDPTFTNGKDMEVEVGVRLQGCQHASTFHLTHVYWA